MAKANTAPAADAGTKPVYQLASPVTQCYFRLIKWTPGMDGKLLRRAIEAQNPAFKDDFWVFSKQRGQDIEFETELKAVPAGKTIRLRNKMAVVAVDSTRAPSDWFEMRAEIEAQWPELRTAKLQALFHDGHFEVVDEPKL
jgi:hypothetical protein